MAVYRQRLQEALLRKCKIENGKCKIVESTSSTTPKFSTLHLTFSILAAIAYVSFTAAWLVAIVTHI